MSRSERGARDASTGASGHGDRIEFLAPRTDAFEPDARTAGDGGPPDAVAAFSDAVAAFSDADDADDADDSRGAPRWAVLLAGVAVVGLVAAGVIVSASSGSDGASSSTLPPDRPATTPVTVSTVSAQPTLPGGVDPVETAPAADLDEVTLGHLLDPVLLPSSWRAAGGLSPLVSGSAGTGDDGRNGAALRANGWLELWASPGASRTTGSWFAVQYTPSEQPFARQDAARIELDDGRIGLVDATPDGVATMRFPVGRATATVTWQGWAQDAIVAIASELRFARSGRPTYGVDGFRSDHERLLSRSSFGTSLTDDLFMSNVISTARYSTRAGVDAAETVEITTRKKDRELDEVLAPFVVADPITIDDAAPGFFTPADAPVLLSGDLVYAAASAPQDLHLVQWTSGDVTVQLTTTLDVAELFRDLPLGLVGAGTIGAWQRQQLGAGIALGPQRLTIDLGGGTLPDGAMWQMNVAPEPQWVNAFVTSSDRGRGVTVQLDLDVRACGTAASDDTTTLICVRPAALGAAVARVEGPWGSLDLPFEPAAEVGAGTTDRGVTDWVVVVHQFDDVGGLSVSVVGANGATTPALVAGDPE